MSVKVGDKAPDFSLFDSERKEQTLQKFAGKNVVLVFYPGAFTSVCTKELCTFRDSLARFNQLNAQVLGVSVDAPFANAAFASQNQLQFPLLSDYNRIVSKFYGGVHENFVGLKGYSVSKRAVFVIDGNGVVKYTWVSENPGVEPNYEEVSAALA
ncbi:MAG TPA: peroxiredoxin [Bacteroidota bacterium]|nr:peroxiredoxin [Bacteroidota bacterium]